MMETELLQTILLTALVIVSAAMIGLIMLQNGKGADAGAAFGGGGGGAMFGAQSSMSFITKMTGWLAAAFFAITFGLAYVASEQAGAVSQVGLPNVPSTDISTPVGPVVPGVTTDLDTAPGATAPGAAAPGAAAPGAADTLSTDLSEGAGSASSDDVPSVE